MVDVKIIGVWNSGIVYSIDLFYFLISLVYHARISFFVFVIQRRSQCYNCFRSPNHRNCALEELRPRYSNLKHIDNNTNCLRIHGLPSYRRFQSCNYELRCNQFLPHLVFHHSIRRCDEQRVARLKPFDRVYL